jgi:branched-chain amino acid transport system substrate-binding protein
VLRFPSSIVLGPCLLAAVALAVAGCGGGGAVHRAQARARTPAPVLPSVDVYSSLPLQGPESAQGQAVLNGIKLALLDAHGRAGAWTIDFTSLDDSTAASGRWDATQAAANATQVAADPRAVLYLGDLDSGASEASMPILNRAGVAQLGPGSTYPGLTARLAVTAPGEPGRYQPSGSRTFARLMPSDVIQARADLEAMRSAHCAQVALADDGEPDGTGLADLIEHDQASYGLLVTPAVVLARSNPAGWASYASGLAGAGFDCFFFAGSVADGAVPITIAVHAAVPRMRLFGGAGVCTATFTNARDGGLPAPVARLVQCTLPVGDLAAEPAGRAFLAAYRARYGGGDPNPIAAYGYEAMELGLAAVAGLRDQAGARAAVVRAVLATRHRASILGTYGFDRRGDSTLHVYALYRVGRSGDPEFVRQLVPGAARRR